MLLHKNSVVVRDNGDDIQYDIVRGEHGARHGRDLLNKTKLSKYELDALFCGDDFEDAELARQG